MLTPDLNTDLMSLLEKTVCDPTTPFSSFTVDDADSNLGELLDTVDLRLNDGRALRFYFVAMPGMWTIEERCPKCGGDLEHFDELSSTALRPTIECYDKTCFWSRWGGVDVKTYVHFEEEVERVNVVLAAMLEQKLVPFFNETADLLTSTFHGEITLDLFRHVGAVTSSVYERF